MSSVLHLYTSGGADQGIHGFAAALGMNLGCQVKVLPLAALPKPDVHRYRALRVERAELQEAIDQAQHDLERYEYGEWQPDAGRESGLRYDLDALNNRLRAVQAVLSTEKGAPDNA